MKIEVGIKDIEKNTVFTGIFNIPTDLPNDGKLYKKTLIDKNGERLEDIEMRSDTWVDFQCILKKKDGQDVSFAFYTLETGKKRTINTGAALPKFGYAKTPWRVSATKLED